MNEPNLNTYQLAGVLGNPPVVGVVPVAPIVPKFEPPNFTGKPSIDYKINYGNKPNWLERNKQNINDGLNILNNVAGTVGNIVSIFRKQDQPIYVIENGTHRAISNEERIRYSREAEADPEAFMRNYGSTMAIQPNYFPPQPPQPPQSQNNNKTILYIGVGVGVLLLLGIGAMVMNK